MNEAVITVTFESRLTTLTSRSVSMWDYRHPAVAAEGFERAADTSIKYISDLLVHKHGRQGANEEPAPRRRLSNRQKVDLIQEIIDTDELWNRKDRLDKIREALTR